jgi:hypothetical protein
VSAFVKFTDGHYEGDSSEKSRLALVNTYDDIVEGFHCDLVYCSRCLPVVYDTCINNAQSRYSEIRPDHSEFSPVTVNSSMCHDR